MDGETGQLKVRADQLFGARKFRRSLQVYLELIARDPADPRLRVRAAELRRRLGCEADAARDYSKAAQLYAAQGYGARARAALKLASALEPQVGQALVAEIDVWAIAARPEEAQPSPRLMWTRPPIELPPEPAAAPLPPANVLIEQAMQRTAAQGPVNPPAAAEDLLPEDDFARLNGLSG